MARAEGGFCSLYSSNIRLVANAEPMCDARILPYEIHVCLHRGFAIGTFSSSTNKTYRAEFCRAEDTTGRL